MTSRQLVLNTLAGKNTSDRAPRHKWALPWSWMHDKEAFDRIERDFPDDIIQLEADVVSVAARGDLYGVGEASDDFGCLFTGVQRGIIGEVKRPIVAEDDWSDSGNVHIPEELLEFDTEKFNEKCRAHAGKFLLCGKLARPFEQLQFMRGTENLFVDLMDMPPKMEEFIEKLHNFYKRLITKYCETELDGIFLMDDWGSQTSLLISPMLWEKVFKPLYRDYCGIARSHGKKVFFHSDGFILPIIPHLIDIGVDALNSQIFCMGLDKLSQFKGEITFWGEIDRQHLLPNGTREQIREAVRSVKDTLWSDGRCIAQCEFGAGANPENVYEVYSEWNAVLP